MQEKTSVMKAQTSQKTQTSDMAEVTQAAGETALPPTSAASAATAPAHSAETSVSETVCIPTQDGADSSAGLQSFSQDFSSSSSADAETEADIATSETAESPSQSDEDFSDETASDEDADGEATSDEGSDGEVVSDDVPSSEESLEGEDYEARAAADTEALNHLFPSLALTSLGELDAPVRFAELRELGLSVEEAFYASNYRMLAGTAALPTPDERRAGKAHMTTARPSASGKGFEVPPSVLHQAHRIFEGMSDREIASLYKRTAK